MAYPVDTTNTRSLIHFNGYHASSIVTDWSGKAWTSVGATLTRNHRKFGNASLELNGSGYISTPDHADWTLGSGAWSIDAWIKGKGISSVLQWDYATSYAIASKYQDESNYWEFGIGRGYCSDPRSGKTGHLFLFYLYFRVMQSGSYTAYYGLINNYYNNTLTTCYPTWTAPGYATVDWISDLYTLVNPFIGGVYQSDDWGDSSIEGALVNSFRHVEVSCDGSNIRFFYNGYQLPMSHIITAPGSTPLVLTAESFYMASTAISDTTGSVYIGRAFSGYGGSSFSNFKGYIDEFRYLNGTCAHTASFPVETAAYKKHGLDSEYTTKLLHFDTSTVCAATNNNYRAIDAGIAISNTEYKWVKSLYVPGTKVIQYAQYNNLDCIVINGAACRYWNIDFWLHLVALPSAGSKYGIIVFSNTDAADGEGSSGYAGIITIRNVAGAYYLSIWNGGSTYADVWFDNFVEDDMNHIALSVDPVNHIIHFSCNGTYFGTASYTWPVSTTVGQRFSIGTSVDLYIEEIRLTMDTLIYTADYVLNTEEYGTVLSDRSIEPDVYVGEEFDTNFRELTEEATVSEAISAGYMWIMPMPSEIDINADIWSAYAKWIYPSAEVSADFDHPQVIVPIRPSINVSEDISSYKLYICRTGDLRMAAFTSTGKCGFNAFGDMTAPAFTCECTTGAMHDADEALAPAFLCEGTAFINLVATLECNMPAFIGTGSTLGGILAELEADMPAFTMEATVLVGYNATTAVNMPAFIMTGFAYVPSTVTDIDYILWHDAEGFVVYAENKMPFPTCTGTGVVS